MKRRHITTRKTMKREHQLFNYDIHASVNYRKCKLYKSNNALRCAGYPATRKRAILKWMKRCESTRSEYFPYDLWRFN